MTKRILIAFALVLLFTGIQASAQVLTFEGLQNLEPILNYYNGGLGGFGSGPGGNYGITFTSDSLAVISNLDGGTGNISNLPSGDTAAFFLTGAGDTMDVAAGFNTGFSFFYSTPVTGDVTVWSGLDGTGTLLATLSLAPNLPGSGPGCNTDYYCVWTPIGVTFAGTAESAIFSGTANEIAFDNITLGSEVPGGVPEPGSIVLLGTAALGLAAILRKKKLA